MQDVYLVAACRTPIGKMGGALKSVHTAELCTIVLKEVVRRGYISAEQVEEIVLGETRPSAHVSNVARHAALLAGFPVTVTAYTIQQACSSSMCAIQCSANKIIAGQADIVIAGGVECMSDSPYYTHDIRSGPEVGNIVLYDSVTESQIGAQPISIFGRLSMGETAEIVAEQYGVTREEQDLFAHQSQLRYQNAYQAGKFKDEIIPVLVPQQKGDPILVDTDEHPRLTSIEKLSTMKPVFRKEGTVTAGNACGRNDGACAVLLMSQRKVQELGLKPMAKIMGYTTAGVDPKTMGIGPVPAVQKVLSQLGMSLSQIDLFEINEAFASQVIACIRELGIDQQRLNVNGGAIALGHPSGSTGARLVTTLAYELMRRKDAKYGLATMCVGGGMGSVVVLEKC